jgi:hypothetical protein
MTHRFTIPPRLVDPFASPVLAGAQDATVLEVTGAPRVQTLIAELFGQQSRGDRRPVTVSHH